MTIRLQQYPDTRPKTRGECADMPRPCPFLSCRYHLAHGAVSPHARPPLNNDQSSDLISGLPESCTLDIADRTDKPSIAEVARHMGVSMQAVQATERRALHKILNSEGRDALLEAMAEAQSARLSRPDFDEHAPDGALMEWSDNGHAVTQKIDA